MLRLSAVNGEVGHPPMGELSMRVLIALAIAVSASSAFAHEPPPKTQPTPSPKVSAPQPVSKTVKSHSGGTDAYGCHTNSQTGDYHCHKPK